MATAFRLSNLLGVEYIFDVLVRDAGVFHFKSRADHGLLEGVVSIRPTDAASCAVTWRQTLRPEHPLERLLVAVAGPFGRRASRSDAAGELRRLEAVVRWQTMGESRPSFIPAHHT